MKKRLLALLRKSSIAWRLMGIMALTLALLLLWCVTVIRTTIRSDRALLRTGNTQMAYELVGSMDAAISALEAVTKFPITLEASGQSYVFQYLRKHSLEDEREFMLNSGVRAEIQGQMGGYARLALHYLKVSWQLPVLILALAAVMLCTAYLLIKSILDPMDRLNRIAYQFLDSAYDDYHMDMPVGHGKGIRWFRASHWRHPSRLFSMTPTDKLTLLIPVFSCFRWIPGRPEL